MPSKAHSAVTLARVLHEQVLTRGTATVTVRLDEVVKGHQYVLVQEQGIPSLAPRQRAEQPLCANLREAEALFRDQVGALVAEGYHATLPEV